MDQFIPGLQEAGRLVQPPGHGLGMDVHLLLLLLISGQLGFPGLQIPGNGLPAAIDMGFVHLLGADLLVQHADAAFQAAVLHRAAVQLVPVPGHESVLLSQGGFQAVVLLLQGVGFPTGVFQIAGENFLLLRHLGQLSADPLRLHQELVGIADL